MKNSFFQKNKNILSIVGAIIAFAVITVIYFSPVLQGKRIKQHDIEMHLGMPRRSTNLEKPRASRPFGPTLLLAVCRLGTYP